MDRIENAVIGPIIISNLELSFCLEVHVSCEYPRRLLRTSFRSNSFSPNAIVFGIARSRGCSVSRRQTRSAQDCATKVQDLQNIEQQTIKR